MLRFDKTKVAKKSKEIRDDDFDNIVYSKLTSEVKWL